MNNRLIREKVIDYLQVLSQEEQYTDTKVARNEIIKGYVEAELMALNKEFRKVQANQMQKWKNSIKDIYKTKYFKDFINYKNEERTNSYLKLLKTCIINQDTIEGFLTGDNSPQAKTKDFFTAFVNYVEKQNKHLINGNVTNPKANVVEIKKGESLGDVNQKLIPDILGAQLINADFFKQIKKLKFTQEEFYTAKHDIRCQWFGIIEEWDVERKIYPVIYQTLIASFDTFRVNKVAAVILGEGGIGKSLLQMRLARDLAQLQEYIILWIDDFEEFIGKDSKTGISSWDKLKGDIDSKYFLFIEDWYSHVDTKGVVSSKDFLESTKKHNNVRIVVGDRYIEGKKIDGKNIQENSYVDYLYDDKNRFEIPLEENRLIIEKILKKNPKWEKVIKSDFNYNDLNKAPLFMLLVIIAKANEADNTEQIDLSEPHVAFRKIIKSKLKKLEALQCTGLAKALYYWSSIYSEYRIEITYETLLVLADYFKGSQDQNPMVFKNLKLRSQVTDVLNSFISIQVHNQFYNHKLFYFNHDILSDYGLSKVIYEGWGNYDEVLLKTILNVIIEKGLEEDASAFFYRMFSLKPALFEDRIEVLQNIDKLIKRGVKHSDYVRIVTDVNTLNLNVEEKDELSLKLLKIENLDSFFWYCIFENKVLKDRWIKRLSDSFLEMDSHQKLLGFALNHSLIYGVECEISQSICKKVLNMNILELNPILVVTVFYLSGSELVNLRRQVSRRILENECFDKIDPSVALVLIRSDQFLLQQRLNIVRRK